jgi:hypothetical protein
LIGRQADTPNDALTFSGPVFHQAANWMVVIAEKDVLPCVELAIRFMSVGDTAVVWSHSKFAYGASQRKYCSNDNHDAAITSLPPHSHVCYQVTIHSIVSDRDRAAPEFAIQAALAKKQIANDIYANELWNNKNKDGLASTKSRTMHLYNRALLYCDQIFSLVGDEADEHSSVDEDEYDKSTLRLQAMTAYIDCLNNMTAVHLRTKDYKQAKATSIRVLLKDSNNAKALVRVAKASLHDPASDYEEVKEAILAAQDVLDKSLVASQGNDSNSSELRALQKDLQAVRAEFQQQKRDYKKKTRDFMSKMSLGLQKPDSDDNAANVDNISEADEGGEARADAQNTDADADDDRAHVDTLDTDADSEDDLNVSLDKLKELKDSIANESPSPFSLPSWKSQMVQSVLQVMLPIAVFWLIRYFQSATKDEPSSWEAGADEL